MARYLSGAAIFALALVCFSQDAAAQGVQTGSVTGVVRDAGGLVLPTATVRAESPVQQGPRMTIADLAGAEQVGRIHVAEALSYRRQAPRN